jgi:hypothetical protein
MKRMSKSDFRAEMLKNFVFRTNSSFPAGFDKQMPAVERSFSS